MQRDVLIVGCDAPYGRAIAARLAGAGRGIAGIGYTDAASGVDFPLVHVPDLQAADLSVVMDRHLPGFRPRSMIVIPRRPRVAPIADTRVEDFVDDVDEALVGAEVAARYLLARRADTAPVQLVLLSGWAALGLPQASTAAAIMGGLLGLARSWALELGPSGIRVNAVIAGAGVEGSAWERTVPPIGERPTDTQIADAVAFLVDERSAAINGQVLCVCGGLTPGIIPI